MLLSWCQHWWLGHIDTVLLNDLFIELSETFLLLHLLFVDLDMTLQQVRILLQLFELLQLYTHLTSVEIKRV